MKHWEPIAGSDIKVGDRITWGSAYTSYEVVRVTENQWYGCNSIRVSDGLYTGISAWFSKDMTRPKRLLATTKEYDPSQQPYTEDDI